MIYYINIYLNYFKFSNNIDLLIYIIIFYNFFFFILIKPKSILYFLILLIKIIVIFIHIVILLGYKWRIIHTWSINIFFNIINLFIIILIFLQRQHIRITKYSIFTNCLVLNLIAIWQWTSNFSMVQKIYFLLSLILM
jgi:hypothetical protein